MSNSLTHRETDNTHRFFLAVVDPLGKIVIPGKEGTFRLVSSQGSRYVPSSRRDGEYILQKNIDGSYETLVGPPQRLLPSGVRMFFSRIFGTTHD